MLQERRQKIVTYSLIFLPIIIFIILVSQFNFIQDDSFITYRYVRNILRGYGPIFNTTERVEGYTNFLWVMILSLCGKLGFSFSEIIPASQLLGVACGICTIALVYFFSLYHLKIQMMWSLFVVLLLSLNYSFAYWAVSGMETGLFTVLITLGVFIFLKKEQNMRSLLTISLILGIASITRPEGTLVWFLITVNALLIDIFYERERRRTKQIFLNLVYLVIPYVVMVAPLFVFRISYFRSLLPNTFYAKTSFNIEYVKTGLAYVWKFMQAYGLWGIIIFVPLVTLFRRSTWRFFYHKLWFVIIPYILYIIAVGGDTLQVFRFFVPLLPLMYLLFVEGIRHIRLKPALYFIFGFILIYYTALNPLTIPGHKDNWDYTKYWWRLEHGLVGKMSITGTWLDQNMDKDEWFAASTIGAISFYCDRNMIDLLGLADTTIARHPEDISGLAPSWRERNYNSAYVLSKLPEYIYFSTGIKPSAAAERALFLRKRFRVGYYPYFFTVPDGRFTETIYKRKQNAYSIPIIEEDVDPSFPTRYRDAIGTRRNQELALKRFLEVIEIAPEDFGYAHAWVGRIYEQQGELKRAEQYYHIALERDSACIYAWEGLSRIYLERQGTQMAMDYITELILAVPDYIYGYTLLYQLVDKNRDNASIKEQGRKTIIQVLREKPNNRFAKELIRIF